MRRAWVSGVLLAAGCVFEPSLGNGNLTCGPMGLCPSGYVCRGDNHCWTSAAAQTGDLGGAARDLSGARPLDLAAPDLAPICTTSARICHSVGESAACIPFSGGFTQQVDRVCPPGSVCASGYCQPPSSPSSCTSTAGCAAIPNDICDPFVGAMTTLQGYCAGRFGTSTGACGAVGFDSTCASGYCISSNAKTLCMTLCAQAGDCPTGTTCAPRLVTVEGLTTMLSVCGY